MYIVCFIVDTVVFISAGSVFPPRNNQNHDVIGILENIKKVKKRAMQRDLVELEQSLFPIYREIASDIKAKKYDLHRNSRELTTDRKSVV